MTDAKRKTATFAPPKLALTLPALLTTFALANGCSLISTSDLTGGLGTCDGGDCAQATDGSPNGSCGADVQTDITNCGKCGHVCNAMATCTNGVCTGGTCATVFVSSDEGSDANSGCDPGAPKKTITSALAAVHVKSSGIDEVHVCRGTYVEPDLLVQDKVALLGGYDCSAWIRTETYGYPTFDGLNTSTIMANAKNESGITISLTGQPTAGAITLDGFTIVSPSAVPGGGASVAVGVIAESAPVLSNNVINGSTTYAGATQAVEIRLAGAPEIFSNRIDGGNGAKGSTGVLVGEICTAYIHGNVINGGTTVAQSTGVSFGIANTTIGGHAVTGNVINGGTSGAIGPVAVNAYKSTVDIVGNVLEAGTCSTTTNCTPIGISYGANAAGGLIAGNRISGGAGGSEGFAIQASGMIDAQIADNALQAGATGEAGCAVQLSNSNNVAIEENTLYGNLYGVQILGASSALSLLDNLFLGDQAGGSVGLEASDCPTLGSITQVTGNAFVDLGAKIGELAVADGSSSGTCTRAVEPTLTAFEAGFASGVASQNVRVDASCSGETASCVTRAACDGTDDATCIESVLAFWDDPSQGALPLLDDTRTWKLSADPPCAISQGGGAALPDMNLDIAGAMRTAPTSAGAFESDGTCTP